MTEVIPSKSYRGEDGSRLLCFPDKTMVFESKDLILVSDDTSLQVANLVAPSVLDFVVRNNKNWRYIENYPEYPGDLKYCDFKHSHLIVGTSQGVSTGYVMNELPDSEMTDAIVETISRLF
jgi:uncharacterized protein (DUF779 family)